MPVGRNLFLVGRRHADEDQLTEMLVWLAEIVPAVSAALVRLAFGPSIVGHTDVSVETQHGTVGGRLDAYLTGADFAVIVESKLGSVYGSDQIRKYLTWLSSDAVPQERRALMTLTAKHAPWSDEDIHLARELGVHGSARRWEELHESLAPIAADPLTDVLGARLIEEFREMIAEEGLIPMKPLGDDELGVAWREAWQVIERYREFFRSCKGHIAAALGATASSTSRSDRGDWFWQDFVWEDGLRMAVGLLNTDRYEGLPPGAKTGAPILWLAPKADQIADWDAVAIWLDRHPPPDWRPGNRWYQRPTCWRYLSEVVGSGSFEEQRDRIASAALVGRDWWRQGIAEASRAAVP
jgi:hypothetical protein